MLPWELKVSFPPIVTPHRPRLTEYAAPKGGTGKPRDSRYATCSGRLKARSRTGARIFEPGRERAQRHLEPHLVVAGGGRAVRYRVAGEACRPLRDGLRLQHALGADAQRIEVAAPHVAHHEVAQHLVEVSGPRIDEMVRGGAERA